MSHRRLWISAVIIAVVIFISFVISVPKTARDTINKTAPEIVESVPVVAIRDTYQKGVHTISGTLTVQNACTTVTANAIPILTASSTTGIEIALTVSGGEGVCLQLPTKATFSSKLTAPSSLPITVTVDGRAASTTPL